MEAFVLAVLVVLAVASRLIEVRLWRAGRLTDRALTVLLLARFPILAFAFGLLVGGSVVLAAGLALLGSLPAVLMFRVVLSLIADQGEAMRRETPGTNSA